MSKILLCDSTVHSCENLPVFARKRALLLNVLKKCHEYNYRSRYCNANIYTNLKRTLLCENTRRRRPVIARKRCSSLNSIDSRLTLCHNYTCTLNARLCSNDQLLHYHQTETNIVVLKMFDGLSLDEDNATELDNSLSRGSYIFPSHFRER